MDLFIFFASIYFYLEKKKHLTLIGFFILTTAYFGYGKNETEFIIKHNISDLGILLSLFLFWAESLNKKSKVEAGTKKILILFLFFILISSLIDIVSGTSLVDIIKTNKNWLVLLTFFTFRNLKNVEIENIIKLIVIITIFQTFLYYIQYFSGFDLYHVHESNYEFGGKDITRGGFPPYFALFSFLLLISNSSIIKLNTYVRVTVIIMVFGTVILSLTRSVLLAFVLAGFLVLFLDKLNGKKIMAFALFSVIFVYILSLSNVMKDRLNRGMDDVKYTLVSNYKYSDVNENFSFRIFHFKERLDYVMSDSRKFVLGLGYVHESSFKKKIFNIGLKSKTGDGVVQLDSGDFSWSVLLLRFGFLGLTLYLLFYGKLIKYFYAFRKYQISKIAFVYLVINLFVLSFVSANISNGFFWPLMFVLLYYQVNLNSRIKSANT